MAFLYPNKELFKGDPSNAKNKLYRKCDWRNCPTNLRHPLAVSWLVENDDKAKATSYSSYHLVSNDRSVIAPLGGKVYIGPT
jgi:hypothetical protein